MILPTVLGVLFVMTAYLYSELDIYQQDQRLYQMSERFYQGKVLSKLTCRKVVSGSERSKSGEVLYNIGKVTYRIQGEEIALRVTVDDGFLFTDYEKINNKKTSLHK